MRNFFKKALQRSWKERGLLSFLMIPLSALYGLLVSLRRQMYLRGWAPVHPVRAKVIVVGNVVVGGAGKTPTVIALVQHLVRSGYRVGVISRGYGRSGKATMGINQQSTAQEVGDEPLLVHRRTGVPVWVGVTRAQAAEGLLKKHPEVQIVLCDDGLQHYALARDLEVCVFDQRGIGNGRLLPAGPLREPWPRHFVAQTGQSADRTLILNTGFIDSITGFKAHRRLEPFAINSRGERIDLSTLNNKGALPLLALAGIAQPQIFFNMLVDAGITVARTMALADHFNFDSVDLQFYKGYQVICTEKDAVKLWPLLPDALAVPLIQEFDSGFVQALDAQVQRFFTAKLSSANGHTTS